MGHVSTRIVGFLLVGLFIGDLVLAASVGSFTVPSGAGSGASISSPGIAFEGAWSVPSLPSSFQYSIQALKGSLFTQLLPAIPVWNNFSASSQLQLDFNQFENVLADLLQHAGSQNSADQQHEQFVVSSTLAPVMQAYSPIMMASAIWNLTVGVNSSGQPLLGTLSAGGQNFTNYSQFLAAIQSSTSFAQLVATQYGWGWTQTCPSNAPCTAGDYVYVPAARYWNPTTLALLTQAYAEQGFNQSAVISLLQQQGYSTALIEDALAKANSMKTQWEPIAYDPAIYGSQPYRLSPGLPQASYIVDSSGNIYTLSGSTQFTGVTADFQNTAIAKNCQNSAPGCTTAQTFWAIVGTNGGYGGVQGGNVPFLEVPTSFVTGLGAQIQQDYPASGNTVISQQSAASALLNPQNPAYAVGSNALIASTVVQDAIYLHYGVTTYQNFEPSWIPGADGVHWFNCAIGCISPNAWGTAITYLGEIEKYSQTWSASHPGQILMFGQPPLESGIYPGYGIASKTPTISDAAMTAWFNGIGQYTAVNLDNALNPTKCGSDANCINLFSGLVNAAYIDPNNPDSITTWFGGNGGAVNAPPGTNAPFLTSYSCGGSGCGWVWAIPIGVLDPACNGNQLCLSPPVNGQTTSTTHYVMANFLQFILNLLNQPNASPYLAKIGITDTASAVAWANKQIAIGNDIWNGKLTQADAPAVASLSDLVAIGAAYFGVNMKNYGTPLGGTVLDTGIIDPNSISSVFNLPFGSPSGPFPVGSQTCMTGCATFSQWYVSQALTQTQNQSPLYQALTHVYVGFVPLGQLLSNPSQGPGTYKLLSATIISAAIACGSTCSLTQIDYYVVKNLRQQGINIPNIQLYASPPPYVPTCPLSVVNNCNTAGGTPNLPANAPWPGPSNYGAVGKPNNNCNRGSCWASFIQLGVIGFRTSLGFIPGGSYSFALGSGALVISWLWFLVLAIAFAFIFWNRQLKF